ncbi:hypothetical protein H6P81_006529 [Aristolochia fimbriata]|uniref:Uncharacterized protein n=1 Tax=Aristolochia fimbriata TaxID=158543 RepID=A0AAV7EZQ9_ARIFI|nr:hypothetical protein H6P81_006529 [Aristolochia fimbriata]
MSSFNNNFDNLLLQSLGRLQLRPPYLDTNSFLSQTLEDLLDEEQSLSSDDNTEKSSFAKEESKLEREIRRIINSGKTDTLKANSGQAVAIGEHHVCVGCHEEAASGYRVWEWHGHIMLFDEENGYTPEYIYGNYFERVQKKSASVVQEKVGKYEENDDEDEDEDSKGGTQGLRDLIGSGGLPNGRILQRNVNLGPSR